MLQKRRVFRICPISSSPLPLCPDPSYRHSRHQKQQQQHCIVDHVIYRDICQFLAHYVYSAASHHIQWDKEESLFVKLVSRGTSACLLHFLRMFLDKIDGSQSGLRELALHSDSVLADHFMEEMVAVQRSILIYFKLCNMYRVIEKDHVLLGYCTVCLQV